MIAKGERLTLRDYREKDLPEIMRTSNQQLAVWPCQVFDTVSPPRREVRSHAQQDGTSDAKSTFLKRKQEEADLE
jgi:hypothetical protein